MQLTRGMQRACAIILALSSVLLAYLVLVHWWLVAPLQQMAEEEQLLQASYQRFAALEAQRDVMQARLSAVREQPLHSDSLLGGSEPQAGSAQLMQLVAERVSLQPATGLACSVLNREPQPAQAQGQLMVVRVSVDLECGIESLAATLHRFENEPPYLRVDALNIRRSEQPAAAPEQAGRLTVQVQVSGYLSVAQDAAHE